MSGIYIPGMEMPNRCLDCSLGIWEDREVMPYCAVTDEYFCVNEFIGKRSEDCPLIAVPDHGRLIDADEFEKFVHDKWEDYDHWLLNYIEARPTIILADKESE